jgi:hypothetical protein
VMPEPEPDGVAPPTPIVVATTGNVRLSGAFNPFCPIVLIGIYLPSSATMRAVSALIVSACVSLSALSSCIDFINAYCKSVW